MRTWCKIHPPEGSKHKKPSVHGATIRAKQLTHNNVSFQVPEQLKAEHEQKKRAAVARFPPNPEDNWGPKRRAGISDKPNKKNKAEEENNQAAEEK
jgi:hypothetical protein